MRSVLAPALAVLNGTAGGFALLLELQFTATLRFSTSSVTLRYAGNDYLGTGILGAVEKVSDSPGESKALRMTLSGIPTQVLAIALAEPVRGKPCLLRLAVLDPESQAILDAPVVWSGTVDQMPVSHQTSEAGESTCTVSVIAEHRGATFGRPKPLRYTDADQRRLYPTDTSLRFITAQAASNVVWPSAAYFRK